MVAPAESVRASGLSFPEVAALEHSQRLCHRIAAAIEENHGVISFARYMELALYEPGLGYYSSGSRKFGPSGDFVTAPEISPVFAQCLARQCEPVLRALKNPDILELGPGSGTMACSLLQTLERMECLPAHYLMLELSADLRQRQKKLIEETIPHIAGRVVWLDRLPQDPFTGIILGNEVLDAMPVHRLILEHGRFQELGVCLNGNGFGWTAQTPASKLQVCIDEVLGSRISDLPEGYQTEINSHIEPWLQSLVAMFRRGLILFIDYGYPRREYYHPQRSEGTLLCHYRHRAHPDPFFYPGLQDITAAVDFTLLAEAASAAGLQVSGYTTQAQFLMGNGLADVIKENQLTGTIDNVELSRQARILTLPGEMGEIFKVMALTRDIGMPLAGFQYLDQRSRL